MKKIDPKALAVSLGLTWSMVILLAGWVSAIGWCVQFVEVMGSVYIGYKPGFVGGIIGAVWAFFDGAIGGLVIALIYNAVTRAESKDELGKS